jgi:hypothetical protein
LIKICVNDIVELIKKHFERKFFVIQPKDVMNVSDSEWEEFKKEAVKDELYYKGEGDLLDTPEGRAKFCRLNETSIFRKDDPDNPGYKIWVFNLQGQGLTIKKRSKVDPSVMEDIEYDANGIEIGKSYEPA